MNVLWGAEDVLTRDFGVIGKDGVGVTQFVGTDRYRMRDRSVRGNGGT